MPDDAEVALRELRHGGEVQVGHVMVGQVGLLAEVLADVLVVERGVQAEGLLDRLDALPDDLGDIDLGVGLGHHAGCRTCRA